MIEIKSIERILEDKILILDGHKWINPKENYK